MKRMTDYFQVSNKKQATGTEDPQQPTSSQSGTDSTAEHAGPGCSEIKNSEDEVKQWYKGCMIDASWQLESFPSVLQRVKLGRRPGLKCKICPDPIVEAKKYARNGQVPIADGVRCDGTMEIKRIIDHLIGDVHSAAVRVDEANRPWTAQSDDHPWIKLLKSHEAETVSKLIQLAVDVYNDSKQMTLSANSWPSRSLAQEHASNLIAVYRDHGLAFQPTRSLLPLQRPSHLPRNA